MASTVGARFMQGSSVATNANIDIKTLQFKPSKVKVTNKTSLMSLEWTEAMGDAAGFKVDNAGTRSFISADGITPLTGANPGFRIGALADINDTAGEELFWEATE